MSRTKVTETVVYTYDELDDDARERVRAWLNQNRWNTGQMDEDMQMIADGILAEHGLAPARGLEYELYAQSAPPSFATEGTWTHQGQTYQLGIAQRPAGACLSAMHVFVYDDEGQDIANNESAITIRAAQDFVYYLRSTMFGAFREHDRADLDDEESARDTCDANDWEFTADGLLV